MVLKGADGGNDDHSVGLETGIAALDIQELLGAQVGTEASLGDGVVAQGHCHARCDDGVAAVSDVGEGAAMNKRRRALESLHQVRLQGILQKGCHGAFGMQVAGSDGLVVAGVSDDHAGQAGLQVVDVGSEAEHGHDLAGDGDIEAVLAREAVRLAAKADDDLAKGTVVHVDDALPGDATDVDVQLVAVVDMSVEHGGKQVVSRTDGMKVAREVQVDVFHRNDLGIAAAGSTALDAENRAKRRLAQSDDGFLALPGKRITQTNGGRGLALACSGGVDGRDQNQFSGLCLVIAQVVVVNLCLVLAVHLEVGIGDADLLGDLVNSLRGCRLGDLDISQHVGLLCVQMDRWMIVPIYSTRLQSSREPLLGERNRSHANGIDPENKELLRQPTQQLQHSSQLFEMPS